jgi:hypothetical protein
MDTTVTERMKNLTKRSTAERICFTGKTRYSWSTMDSFTSDGRGENMGIWDTIFGSKKEAPVTEKKPSYEGSENVGEVIAPLGRVILHGFFQLGSFSTSHPEGASQGQFLVDELEKLTYIQYGDSGKYYCEPIGIMYRVISKEDVEKEKKRREKEAEKKSEKKPEVK